MRIMGLSLKAEKGRGWGLKKKRKNIKKTIHPSHPRGLVFSFGFTSIAFPKNQ